MKYKIPFFLDALGVSQRAYYEWLYEKGKTIELRDRRRLVSAWANHHECIQAVHHAMLESKGICYYTAKILDWTLLSALGMERCPITKAFERPSIDHFDILNHKKILVVAISDANRMKGNIPPREFYELCALIAKRGKRAEVGARGLLTAKGGGRAFGLRKEILVADEKPRAGSATKAQRRRKAVVSVVRHSLG